MEESPEETCRQVQALWEQGDKTQAALLLERCAAKGHAPAQCMLGDFLRLEKGDAWGAVAWYCRAAGQGDAAAVETLRDLARTDPPLRNRMADFLSPHQMAQLGVDSPAWDFPLLLRRLLSLLFLAAVPVCLWCFGSHLHACMAGRRTWADASLPLWLSEIGALFCFSCGYGLFRQAWLRDASPGSRPLFLIPTIAWVAQLVLLLLTVAVIAAFF